MTDVPDITEIAGLIADGTRSKMLAALMSGRALTATELAIEGDVSPSTASSHLAKLVKADVLKIVRQGRHRYFRLVAPEVAVALEGMMAYAARANKVRTGPKDPALRYARVCYDHLAGEAAVRLYEGMRRQGLIEGQDDAPTITVSGEGWLCSLGVDLDVLKKKRAALCRSCLDWSERKMHLGGAVGAALLQHFLDRGYAKRDAFGRAVRISGKGERFLASLENENVS